MPGNDRHRPFLRKHATLIGFRTRGRQEEGASVLQRPDAELPIMRDSQGLAGIPFLEGFFHA